MASPTACPNCGAPITFRWSSAVQTTCPYCRSILVRHDVDLERVGQVGDLPRTPSPIQLGASGRWGTESFHVVGRLIYRYERGTWNEWHCITQRGASLWLADAQAQYAVSQLVTDHPPLPAADALRVGQPLELQRHHYQVQRLTPAHYEGTEGELPFEYWDKTTVLFADLASTDDRFGTIDYSDPTPLLFLGQHVSFDELQLAGLVQFEGW
jgi:hypothetical protein